MTAMTDTSAGAPADPGRGGAGESRKLTRTEASDAVSDLGWRYVLGVLRTTVPAASFADGAEVARQVAATAGPDADGSLALDVRPGGVVVSLQSRALGEVTAREARLARQITGAVRDGGHGTESRRGGTAGRSVQMLEIAIDALDIAVDPAVLAGGAGLRRRARAGRPARTRSSTRSGRARRSGSSRWTPRGRSATASTSTSPCRTTRPQTRIDAALAAGGRLLADDEAPAFWVLADAEGNEACITTWQGRDPV